jgi:hypothetical protein
MESEELFIKMENFKMKIKKYIGKMWFSQHFSELNIEMHMKSLMKKSFELNNCHHHYLKINGKCW